MLCASPFKLNVTALTGTQRISLNASQKVQKQFSKFRDHFNVLYQHGVFDMSLCVHSFAAFGTIMLTLTYDGVIPKIRALVFEWIPLEML